LVSHVPALRAPWYGRGAWSVAPGQQASECALVPLRPQAASHWQRSSRQPLARAGAPPPPGRCVSGRALRQGGTARTPSPLASTYLISDQLAHGIRKRQQGSAARALQPDHGVHRPVTRRPPSPPPFFRERTGAWRGTDGRDVRVECVGICAIVRLGLQEGQAMRCKRLGQPQQRGPLHGGQERRVRL
jgi:hypothetical protein